MPECLSGFCYQLVMLFSLGLSHLGLDIGNTLESRLQLFVQTGKSICLFSQDFPLQSGGNRIFDTC